jgi:16S rRNA (guanine(966)-N(2))-methyltransferase RsmD
MTRIIAGRAKGRRLKSPAGHATRPTGARVRKTLFDILAPRLAGCRFLDAFAGAGAVGLEALSRGAEQVVLLDTSAAAVAAIRENLRVLRGPGSAEVHRQDARVALAAFGDAGRRFDVIYLDPPYDSELYEPCLERIAAAPLLSENGVVVAEHFHKRPLPARIGGLARVRIVRVGDHQLSFYEPSQRAEEAPLP